MEGSDGSPPPSLCMIRAAELFPKPSMEKEDNQLIVPFQELAGESVKYLGRTDDGVLALSNYRIFLLKNSTCSETSVPLGLIESAQTRDLFHLVINCKDASTVKCSFETAEQCSEWQRRITLSVGVPESLESMFAFPFYSWTSDSSSAADNQDLNTGRLLRATRFEDDFRREVERLQFDLNGPWRISQANNDFKLCPSYPQMILVPCCISDETLHNVANFRGSRRLPAVVWRHKKSGAVIARCSQPEVGWLGWRNSKDEQLLKALADACAFDRGEQNRRMNLCTSGDSTPSSPDGSHEEVTLDEVRKILIVDARSYTSAVTNRARGGGCECIEYYPSAEIEFMNLGNIHVIRKSFHALRQLCASPPDVPNWLGLLEKTTWLQHLSGLLAASVTVCHAIEKKGRPVLVHCSDGWDRTPQIVATAQLCLDPFYRTVEGFRILVEREWLQFGHKFADRCGHGPGSDEVNERCPVFLQWLDLVHQIHKQFPCSFEFSMGYLIKLAQHSHSCLFGTFLCNTLKERLENSVFERTFSVWPFLSGPMYRNPLYIRNKEKVLWPAHNVRDLYLWTEVYLGSLGNQNVADFPPCTGEGNPESTNPMTKTRSYGDLLTAGSHQNGLSRRSSDPNMTVESNLMSSSGVSNHHTKKLSTFDMDLSPSPDIESTSSDLIANIIHDTTQKLQNLTSELNQNDEEICKINKIHDDEAESGPRQPEVLVDLSSSDDVFPTYAVQFQKHKNEIQIESISRDDDCNKVTLAVINSSLDVNSSPSNSACDDDDDVVTTREILFDDLNGDVPRNGLDVAVATTNDTVDGVEYGMQAIQSNALLEPLNLDLMESVDLRDKSISPLTSAAGSDADEELPNPWYGSVNTSTDTLVPNESHHQVQSVGIKEETTDYSQSNFSGTNDSINYTNNRSTTSKNELKSNANIQPEVHCKPNFSNSVSETATTNTIGTFAVATTTTTANRNNQMEESILILPEHQKLEISSSGKCETIANFINQTTSSHRRRRTSSSNSKNDFITVKGSSVNGSAPTSRFSTPGVRSLPLTPPAILDRPQIAISCPDGLAHALSEQNIRLQQIVYEHKIREDALIRELHGMRMALLKKTCPNCNYLQSQNNDDQNSAMDNMENMSVCSWEAVEDKSGPSSCASSIQPSGSVLWVPDHAVSRCTSCQTEFWLGRRKHHCRSCGQIFCADCSEFWAPLPDIRLYNPVRLCGPCYHAVTTRLQQQCRAAAAAAAANNGAPGFSQFNSELSNVATTLATAAAAAGNSSTQQHFTGVANSSLSNNLIANVAVVSATSVSAISCSSSVHHCHPHHGSVVTPTAMEACKHAASPPRNERGPLKATTASN